MAEDAAPIAVDAVIRDLFGLILCARPGEAAELRVLLGLAPAKASAAGAAALTSALQARIGEEAAAQAGFVRRVLAGAGAGAGARAGAEAGAVPGAPVTGNTIAELDATLLSLAAGPRDAGLVARFFGRLRDVGRAARGDGAPSSGLSDAPPPPHEVAAHAQDAGQPSSAQPPGPPADAQPPGPGGAAITAGAPGAAPAASTGLAAETRIAVLLATIRTRIMRRAALWSQPVAWPALPEAALPAPAPPARIAQVAGIGGSVLGAAGAALDMTGLTRALSAKWEERQAEMGKVNILIAGRSGVGKSTLVNAIFGREVAKTGLGRPVTDSIAWYEPDDLPVRLCDTRGLELARYAETLGALRDEIRRADPPIHVLWLCIAEPSGRIEDAERELLAMCRAQGIPGITVLTKAWLLEDMTQAAREGLPGTADVIRVMARGADGGPPRGAAAEPPRGIVELVQSTLRLLEGSARDAFNAAQQVDIEAKRSAALKVAAGAAASAGLAAATPVPLADSAGVLTVNIGMIAGIAVAMGVPLSRANMLPVATSIVGALAVTFGARMLGGSILKLIPGVGSVVGGAINAGLASSATYGLGHGFTEYLCRFFLREHRMPAGEELARGFQAFWEKWDRKKDAPPKHG